MNNVSEKFKKIDKEFCVTDNSVNVYGYRCLTEGLQLGEVKKNPIGFLMHNRDKGVVVRWDDFRIEGDAVFAKPVINLSHPDGQNIADQVESGFLNAASVGKIVVLQASNNPDLKLKDQTRPTVTKWFPREISLVDIPGNYNALANLYDAENHELDLADLENFSIKNMSNVSVTAVKILTALNLSDAAQETDVLTAVQDLIDKAEKAEKFEKDLADKTAELDALKKESITKKVEDLLAKGVEESKITNEVAESLKESFAENPTGLENLIAKMPAQVSVSEAIKTGDEGLAKYAGKTWDDLYKSNELETVQKEYPDLFAKLKSDKYKPQS